MNSRTGARSMRATLRLQFRGGMTLDGACALVPQFARMGISHLYASPLCAARPGSTHGYDTIAYDRIDPELGGEAALLRLTDRLHAHGMGLILDIVPNHMAVDAGNAWWLDVLAWGRASAHANWFDIEWHAPDPELHGKVLLPFLDRPVEDAITAGLLYLRHDEDSGLFFIHHHEHRFPLCPAGYAGLLAKVHAPAPLLVAWTRVAMRAGPCAEVDAALAALRQWAGTDEGTQAMCRLATLHDATNVSGRRQLEELLAAQAWQPAFWREAATRINWRRFFDITGLVGVCVEREEVFEAVHAYVFSLYQRGVVDGLRVDHVDGLDAPAAYCQRLRERLDILGPLRPERARPGGTVYVEKILVAGESLPTAWPVDGTTGYDFMDQVGAVLHDGAGAVVLDRLWATCGPDAQPLDPIVKTARAQLLEHTFCAEFTHLSFLLERVLCGTAAACALHGLHDALCNLLVQFHPYRTYFGDEAMQDHTAGCAALQQAERAACAFLANGQHAVMSDMVRFLEARPEQAPPVAVRHLQLAFEHLTAPLAAKSLEDTAFYRYGRLLSRNEVGSDPQHLALPVAAFHAACAERAASYPHALLATATHDHKRGEDARARLTIISEAAEEWEALVQGWFAHNGAGQGCGPDRIDELMLYQTLVGAWPLLPFGDEAARARFVQRITQWQTKALREAKRHTGWTRPDEAYETACTRFVERLLDPARSTVFLRQLEGFVTRIAPAGALNGLAQTLLRLCVPGVPDLYQGCDLWDFSLVDPDNRSAVDFAHRATLLEQATGFASAAATWRTGRIKQDMIRRILSFRQHYPGLFASGNYVPVVIGGADQAHAIAFLRQHDGMSLLVVAPRLPLGLRVDADTLALGHTPDISIELPALSGPWHSLLGDVPPCVHAPFVRGGVPIACLVHDPRIA
ncbi:malto-oligosyltrehalose synthase [Komagataeibacter medellinensis]|uniref:1,4-alpha-D-glucan 1-alpha-D-glucosylmutase n=1 Tax=Komagataeibacter medellinensis (strain NBRC 3288 / BCRC 11682 / LMG 1693 / Kondo 51) TaxID=634177 RepID=G2I2E7_KOMMN|nr:malto-oligosyltrehalose synthase [Komagataeibacter medellinensis]BAK82563.1 1,4-alpha-D-glucan 1-alpha-D-glucosylmutase [Komagataeibacter medellinensis NBRC 3288]